MASVERMARPAREAHTVTVAPRKATAARRVTVMLDASPSLVPAMLRLTSPPMVSVARTERLAREAPTATAAPRRVTVERKATVAQDAKLLLVLARPTPALSLPTVVAEASMARPARAVRTATVVPLEAGVVIRKITAMLAVSPSSVLATARPATFPPMASAVRTARPVREAPMVIAVLLRATVEKKVIARLAARRSSVPAMRHPAMSPLMEAVVRMARLAKAVPLVIVALSMATVARVTPSAAMVARRLLASAPVSHPTLSVVPETARLVLDLALETVVLLMDTVEAPPLTVVKAAKKVPRALASLRISHLWTALAEARPV